MKFSELVATNPKIDMEKGKEYEFVEMADVTPGNKYVYSKRKRKLKGGSRFQSGDVLFARITPCLEHGKIAQFKSNSDKPAFGSTEFFVFRKIKNVSDQDYVYYLSLTDTIRKPAEKSMVGASGRQRANLEAIKDIEIDPPEFPLQRKIAIILSKYDDLIENNRKRIHLLEKIAKLIYDEWFVKFKFPGHEKVKLVDSELGKIPEGWEVKKVEEVIKNRIKIPKKIKKSDFLEEGLLPIIDQSRSFIAGYTNDTEAKFEELLPIIIFGDHTRVLKFIDFPFAYGADGIQLIYPIDKSVSPEFLYFSLLHIDLSNFHYTRHYKFLKSTKLIVPQGNIVKLFNEIVKLIMRQINKLDQENRSLSKIRDLLLPKLISEEVDVSDLDIKIKEVKV